MLLYEVCYPTRCVGFGRVAVCCDFGVNNVCRCTLFFRFELFAGCSTGSDIGVAKRILNFFLFFFLNQHDWLKARGTQQSACFQFGKPLMLQRKVLFLPASEI